MPGLLRIVVMTIVTFFVLTMLVAGPSRRNLMFGGGLVAFFATLPILVIMSILHGVEVATDTVGRSPFALIGLAPAIFFLVMAPSMGVKGGQNAYSITGCVSGLIWSAAWILTG